MLRHAAGLGEAEPTPSSQHDVVEYGHSQKIPRRSQAPRERFVLCGGGGVAAGVVVDKYDRSSGLAQGDAKDLPGMDEARGECSLRDPEFAQETALAVE